MAIATLIAAGRLDDRLVQFALDLWPGAEFGAWIDEGDAATSPTAGLTPVEATR